MIHNQINRVVSILGRLVGCHHTRVCLVEEVAVQRP